MYIPTVTQFPEDLYAKAATKVHSLTASSIQIPIFGNDQQFVLMNADSEDNSENVTVTLSAIG